MMHSPAAKQASTTPADARYIHEFGHALARKLLGASLVDDCVRRSQWPQRSGIPAQEEPIHFLRANWRSNARFPWELPKPESEGDAVGRLNGGGILAETLLVNVTFDFVLFPAEIVTEGRNCSCHVLNGREFLAENESATEEECDSVAIAVAVRIGTLVAIPSRPSDGSYGEERKGSNGRGGGDGYRCYYHRGEDALTESDLDEHCRGIDIVLEEMAAADVGRIVGGALLEGRHAGEAKSSWRVEGRAENDLGASATAGASDPTAVDNTRMDEQTPKRYNWNLKVHYRSLDAEGSFPLSSNGCVMGEPIGTSVLDMILLQHNDNGCACVSVPKTEALMLWKRIDPDLAKVLVEPVGLLQRKRSPARRARDESPRGEKVAGGESRDKPKTAMRRQPRLPEQSALFARGKKTTLGGSRRKKPKFTLGPA